MLALLLLIALLSLLVSPSLLNSRNSLSLLDSRDQVGGDWTNNSSKKAASVLILNRSAKIWPGAREMC